MLKEMQSSRFEIELPAEIGGEWADTYVSMFTKFAPRPTKGEKRHRAEVVAAVEALAPKRARG